MKKSQENKLFFEGNVVRDAKCEKGGKTSRLSFSMASNKYYGENEQRVTFIDVIAFGLVADKVGSVSKGEQVYVVGELQTNTWEKNGEKKSKTEILAHKILFQDCGKKGSDEEIPFD